MKHPKVVDPEAALTALTDAGVEFIVVGGMAALLHGAPITTQDLDIVHRRTPENVERLLGVLLRLDGIMRYDLANRGLRPTAVMLAGSGQVNVSTTLGPIDPLCELDPGQGYEELLAHTEVLSDRGLTLRVLDLPTLIAVKRRVGRPKDLFVIPILMAAMRQRARTRLSARAATDADLASLAAMNARLVEDEASRNPMTVTELEARMRGWLEHGTYRIEVLVEDGGTVGYAVWRAEPDEYVPARHVAHIRQLYVERSRRGRGLGRAALGLLSSRFPPGCTVVVEALESNPAARRFWERAGFVPYATTLRLETTGT